MENTPKIVTLVYLFDERNRVLLVKRNTEPNLGLFSPPGGKVEAFESPKECAIRELREETGLSADCGAVRLIGLVTETGFDNPDDWWLMFLYRVELWKGELKPELGGADVSFASVEELEDLPLPRTDREILWPRVLSGKFFDIMVDCSDIIPLVLFE